MSDLTSQDLVQALAKKNLRAFDQWMRTYGAAFYSTCFSLCLQNPEYTQKLFTLSVQATLKGKPGNDALDIWFYRQLHHQWQKFTRFRKDLWASTLKRAPFDWHRPIGRQHQECLERLIPDEREIFVHRLVNQYNMVVLMRITGKQSGEISDLFHSAIVKLA